MEQSNNQGETDLFSNLDDVCLDTILKQLAWIDFANFAQTCRRFKNVAEDFSSRNHRTIHIDLSDAADSKISKQELPKILSRIGQYVMEVEVCCGDDYVLSLVRGKCTRITKVSTIDCVTAELELCGFRNLKKLVVTGSHMSLNGWKCLINKNAELESLTLNYPFFTNELIGLMELLTHLPKLRSLGLAEIRQLQFLEPDGRHLFRMTALTKLTLKTDENLNGILGDLANCLTNLSELQVDMVFNTASFGMLASFRNLETLSIKVKFVCFGADFKADSFILPTMLRRLKVEDFGGILCINFLKLIQPLTLLREVDLGDEGTIFCDDVGKFFFYLYQNVEGVNTFIFVI